MKLLGIALPVVLLLVRRYKEDIVKLVGVGGLRWIFVASMGLVFLLLFLVWATVKGRRDQGRISFKEKTWNGPEKVVTLSVEEYDLTVLYKLIAKNLLVLLIGWFLLFKMAYYEPLLLLSLSQPINLLESALIQIHVFGQPAGGELKRPFKDNGFFSRAHDDDNGPDSGRRAANSLSRSSSGAMGVVVRSNSSRYSRSSSIGSRAVIRRDNLDVRAVARKESFDVSRPLLRKESMSVDASRSSPCEGISDMVTPPIGSMNVQVMACKESFDASQLVPHKDITEASRPLLCKESMRVDASRTLSYEGNCNAVTPSICEGRFGRLPSMKHACEGDAGAHEALTRSSSSSGCGLLAAQLLIQRASLDAARSLLCRNSLGAAGSLVCKERFHVTGPLMAQE